MLLNKGIEKPEPLRHILSLVPVLPKVNGPTRILVLLDNNVNNTRMTMAKPRNPRRIISTGKSSFIDINLNIICQKCLKWHT